MKLKAKLTILMLTLSLAGLTAIATTNHPVKAWLGCSQLKGCTGSGGCNDGNENSQCVITCADGTIVNCPPQGGGGN